MGLHQKRILLFGLGLEKQLRSFVIKDIFFHCGKLDLFMVFFLGKLFTKFLEIKNLELFLFVLVSAMLVNLLLLTELMEIQMKGFAIILFNLMIQLQIGTENEHGIKVYNKFRKETVLESYISKRNTLPPAVGYDSDIMPYGRQSPMVEMDKELLDAE